MQDTLLHFKELSDTDYIAVSKLEQKFHSLYIQLANNTQLSKLYEANWGIGIVFYMYILSKMPIR